MSAATVLGAVKDIAGTLVAVMVSIIAVRHLFVKKATDFDDVFNAEMEKLLPSILPLSQKTTMLPDDIKLYQIWIQYWVKKQERKDMRSYFRSMF